MSPSSDNNVPPAAALSPSLRYQAATLCVFAVAVYLCLINLDYVAFWHDEGNTVGYAKNLLLFGDITGWDGRNIIGGYHLNELNKDLRSTWPPLSYVFSALGMALFGINEVGARIVHALIGVIALAVFYLLLQRQLPNAPRLVFLIFLFVALSTQLLLFFRQARYYAFMILALILLVYFYQRFLDRKKIRHLAAITVVGILAFLNHYTTGVALLLTLVVWHLLFHAKETTGREWALAAAAAAVVATTAIAYFQWVGLIENNFADISRHVGEGVYDEKPLFTFFLRILIYLTGLLPVDWVSWPVLLWFVLLLLTPHLPFLPQWWRDGMTHPQTAAVTKIILLGVLATLFLGALSTQRIYANPKADLRYYVAVLPFLLAMKAFFVDWLWDKNKLLAAAALVILLFTNYASFPIEIHKHRTLQNSLAAHLLLFIREVHSPYPDSIAAVSNYLRQKAKKDDLVYVKHTGYREAVGFYVGDHVRLCCFLPSETAISRHTINELKTPAYADENIPDWLVFFKSNHSSHIEDAKKWMAVANYVMEDELLVYYYPTQRPAFDFHHYAPVPHSPGNGIIIARRVDDR